MKKLLIEYTPFAVTPQKINESITNNNGRLIVTGVIQRANVPNQNSRVYPKDILEREVARYIAEEVAQNRALGELDHPEDSVVNLRNVSHNIIDIKWNGDDVIGTIEILTTPSGNILRELLKNGITVGISSRGMGSVRQLYEDTVEVDSDFSLLCWDFVSNPSTHGAFMKPVNESINVQNSPNDYAHQLIRDIVCDLSGVCCLKK